MTAVCSVGLDMIVVPGDTSADVISAVIADEAAIGMVNTKTTAVRLIPAIGKKPVTLLTLVVYLVTVLLWNLEKVHLLSLLTEVVRFLLHYRHLRTN